MLPVIQDCLEELYGEYVYSCPGYRQRLSASGLKRIEVTVPTGDAALVRRLVEVLRTGDETGEHLRRQVRSALGMLPAQTGEELVAFFRSSPLVGEELVFERDRSPGRPVEL